MPQGIFGDRAGDKELLEVIGPAGFWASAGKFEAAEWLAIDQGAGDTPVDIEIADAEFTPGALDVRGAARVDAAGQGVIGGVGQGAGRRPGRSRA